MAGIQKEQPMPITSFTRNAVSPLYDAEKGKDTSITESPPFEAPPEVIN